MGNLLSLYFLHPITTRLANKTQRIYSRYELTNPTKTPPSPFAFSLLSVILLHLHYTLQSPFSLCYYPPFSCYPVSSYPVPPLLTLCYYPLFSCYPVSSYPVPPLLILCYYPSFLCYSVLLLPCPASLSCKECLPVLSTGAFTLSKTRPFKHAEHALLAP